MGKQKPSNEVEVVKTLHEALQPLDPGSRARVIQAVMTLLQVDSLPNIPSLQQTGEKGAAGSTFAAKQGEIQADKIDKFLAHKKPKDTYQRLACLAYFLEHKEDMIDLTVKELRQANSDARQANISNIGWFLDLATRRHGFFSAAGKGKKRLSSRGSAVVEALPDQSAVKVALDDNPLPKKGGRKRKSKKG